MLSKELRIRSSDCALIGVLGVLAAALALQPALASGKGRHHRARHATSASGKNPRGRTASGKGASGTGSGKGEGGSGSGKGEGSANEIANADAKLHAAAEAAVEGLVRDGTIDQHQAEVIDVQIDAGTVNPEELVQRGVLGEAQMQAAANALGEVKRSFAPGGPGGEGTGVKSPSEKKGGGTSDTAAADARLHAAVEAALERLVRGGAIDQHQAEVIDGQIDAGSLNPEELVQHGVLSEAQMQVVANALAEAKRSFAG
jgi:hypothetical protein